MDVKPIVETTGAMISMSLVDVRQLQRDLDFMIANRHGESAVGLVGEFGEPEEAPF